jgi:hypothetical protein
MVVLERLARRKQAKTAQKLVRTISHTFNLTILLMIHFQIGVGKFVYSQRFYTRLFDLETSQVGKQIRVPRIFATGEQ